MVIKAMVRNAVTQPNAHKYIVTGLGLTVLIVGGALSWLGATAPPELASTPVVEQSGEWLYTATPDLGFSREQFELFLLNRDPSLGQQGLLWNEINAEAYRFLGEAYRNVQNPKDKQFGNTVIECLEAFEINIQKEHAKALTPSDRAKAIIRLLAAELAIDAVLAQQPLIAGEPQNALFQTILEKRKIDRGAARMQTPDGIAAQYQRDKAQAEKELKAEEKARKEFEGK